MRPEQFVPIPVLDREPILNQQQKGYIMPASNGSIGYPDAGASDITERTPSHHGLRYSLRPKKRDGCENALRHPASRAPVRVFGKQSPDSPSDLYVRDDISEYGPDPGRFPLGEVVATFNAIASLSPLDAIRALARHSRCDWGEVDNEDKAANDRALAEGTRLLSAYTSLGGVRFWVITEADRSSTTILLPEDY